ncbi:MAG: SixA phosphatase family protein [Propioniciclava sp.]
MTRTLVVMRHAKSSWKTNDTDLRRPLSGRGTRDAVVAGQELSGAAFDVALLSPAARVTQTWQCLALNGVTASEVKVVDALYPGSRPDALALLQGLPSSAHRVLMLGHEPTLSDLVLWLCGNSPYRAQVERKYPTSALAVLTSAAEWTNLDSGQAELVAFEVPRG